MPARHHLALSLCWVGFACAEAEGVSGLTDAGVAHDVFGGADGGALVQDVGPALDATVADLGPALDATVADIGSASDATIEVPPDPSLVFDETIVRTYELTIAPADWQWVNDNARLEQYVPASLTFEGTEYPNIGFRYKGGYGTLRACFDAQGMRICDKLSIKLKWNEYDPAGRFYGLKRLNFHGMESDPTKMHDAIGYKLFRDDRVFAPRTAYARVIVNGTLLGLFVVVEQIDGVFTRSRFDDGGEGNLYKEVWPVYSVPAPYLGALRTNEDQNPSVDKMLRFAAALGSATDETFSTVLGQWMDVDMLMRHQAVARLIDHWDGIVAWYCTQGPCFNHNYYWYESTTEDRVWLIPWDLDHTFEEPSPVRTYFGMPDWDDLDAVCTPIPVFLGIQGLPPSCDPFIRRMVLSFWDRYVAESNVLLDGDFSEASMDARITELQGIIKDAVAEDPDLDSSAWEASVAKLRDDVRAKRAYIEAKIGR